PGASTPGTPVPRRRAARARRPDGGRRPQGQGLLRRDEAPPRPGARAGPPPARALPRRADDRARPAEPLGPLDRGRTARARGRLPREDRPLARRRRRRGGSAGGPGDAAGRMSNLPDEVYALARRSVVRTSRMPAQWIAPLIFPTMLLAVNSGGLKAVTHLPGFPTTSYVAFALAVPFIQGALFATMNAGTELARDIQTGFLNRLALTPLRGAALLAGHLGGVVALGLVQACFYLAVGLAVGVRPASGVGGVAVLLVFAALIALAFGS